MQIVLPFGKLFPTGIDITALSVHVLRTPTVWLYRKTWCKLLPVTDILILSYREHERISLLVVVVVLVVAYINYRFIDIVEYHRPIREVKLVRTDVGSTLAMLKKMVSLKFYKVPVFLTLGDAFDLISNLSDKSKTVIAIIIILVERTVRLSC